MGCGTNRQQEGANLDPGPVVGRRPGLGKFRAGMGAFMAPQGCGTWARPKQLGMKSTATPKPFSARMFSPGRAACLRMSLSVTAIRMARERLATVSFFGERVWAGLPANGRGFPKTADPQGRDR